VFHSVRTDPDVQVVRVRYGWYSEGPKHPVSTRPERSQHTPQEGLNLTTGEERSSAHYMKGIDMTKKKMLASSPPRYIRVVLAVPPSDEKALRERLDEWIESDDSIWGAYVSDSFDTRKGALGSNWKDHSN